MQILRIDIFKSFLSLLSFSALAQSVLILYILDLVQLFAFLLASVTQATIIFSGRLQKTPDWCPCFILALKCITIHKFQNGILQLASHVISPLKTKFNAIQLTCSREVKVTLQDLGLNNSPTSSPDILSLTHCASNIVVFPLP